MNENATSWVNVGSAMNSSITNNDQSQGTFGNSTVTDNGIKDHQATNPGTAGISNNPTTDNGNNSGLTPRVERDVGEKTDIGTSPDPPAPVPANDSKLLSPTNLASQVIPPKIFATTYMTVVNFHIRQKNNVVKFNLEEIFGGMVIANCLCSIGSNYVLQVEEFHECIQNLVSCYNSNNRGGHRRVCRSPTYCSNRSICKGLWYNNNHNQC